MAMSSTTTNLFYGRFRQPGLLESNVYAKSNKHSNVHRLLHSKGSYMLDTRRSLAHSSPTASPLASGKQGGDRFASDMSEVTDEVFDDLFAKYGKVVFQRNDRKTSSAEADDDAVSLSFAVDMARVADEAKAADTRVLFVKPLVYWTSFFIIATAFSRPQIDAIRYKVRDLAEKKYRKVGSGDTKPNSWTLMDFGDVVIHVFLPEQRALYNLEEFYGNATNIELPFQKRPFCG